MKQKDIALIVVIGFFSAIFSLVISNVFLATPDNLTTTVEKVPVISAEFSEPDDRYFNAEALNPTRIITIGENTNQDPFQSSEDN